MPHVSIKHFPVELSEARSAELIEAVTAAVTRAFEVEEAVVSIALEPVPAQVWNETVYQPEIVQRQAFLRKTPNY